jgi:hypothetical protein
MAFSAFAENHYYTESIGDQDAHCRVNKFPVWNHIDSAGAHLDVPVRAGHLLSSCIKTVSKPYLTRALGLSVERRADSPGYWKD